MVVCAPLGSEIFADFLNLIRKIMLKCARLDYSKEYLFVLDYSAFTEFLVALANPCELILENFTRPT